MSIPRLVLVTPMTMLPAVPALAATASFSDQSAASGIVASHQPAYGESFLAGGAVGDFNRDGWQDIYVPVGGGAPDRLFINNGDGTFTDRAAEWGIAATHRSTAAAVADYDNDGWTDLFVTSLGPAGASAVGHHRLYRNMGNGTFTNQAIAAGVNQSSSSSADGWGAAWGDYDLDGDLDLAVAGWNTNDGNRLFRNDGDGTFTDVTASAGLGSLTGVNGFAPRIVDMNGDRYPELIWIGDFGTSRYYRNDGDGTFTDFTAGSGTAHDFTEMGCTVADYDQDGDFDFYVTTISTNNLYLNQGNDVYVNQASSAGVANTGWGWGAVSIDFDHDSRIDLVATTQSGRQYAFHNQTAFPNALDFDEVALDIGIDTGISGRGLANLDYDNDGDQDLVFFPRSGPVKLFRNDLTGADTNWLRIQLENGGAADIPPHGIGAVVKIVTLGGTRIGRIDGGSNYCSQSEMTAHFGLATDPLVISVIVEWSNGATTQVDAVSANQTLVIAPGGVVVAGDINRDGVVDFTDLLAVLNEWGPCGSAPCVADVNGDGTVGFSDLTTVLGNWS